MTTMDISMRRRTLLSTGLAGIGGSMLAGCGDSSSSNDPGPKAGNVSLPGYIPRNEIKPDLTSDDSRIPAGYLTYPADPVSVNKDVPGRGGDVTGLCEVGGALPPALDRNVFWQKLNERLGVTLKLILAPAGTYSQKFQTLVAGDELPEIVQIKSAPDLPDLLAARFEPLTDYLAGDNVKEYPNLAAIPTYSWTATVYNGEVFGAPFAQPAVSSGLFARQDIVEKLGLESTPKSGAEFLELCREVTSPRENRYALCGPGTMLTQIFAPMFDGPNKWKVVDGKFVHQFETEEFASALNEVAKAVAAGLFHPDSFVKPQVKQWFGSGAAVFNHDSLTSIAGYQRDYGTTNPEFRMSSVVLPRWNGGGIAAAFQGTGIYTFAAIRKGANKDRVKELLRIINWLAAPFGSEEYLFRQYGIKDRNYRLEGTDPIPEGAITELYIPTSYIGRGAPFIYSPGRPDDTRAQFEFQKTVAPGSKPQPSVGLHAPSEFGIGATIGKNIGDLYNDIMIGRKPMSEWAAGVKAWKSGGGDKIAAEFSQAYAKANE